MTKSQEKVRANNREAVKKYRRKNLERVRASSRASAKRWRAKYPERARDVHRRAYAKDPERILATNSRSRAKHRDARNAKRRQNRELIKVNTLTAYSTNPPRCACCGETYLAFLTIDHIYGGGSAHTRQLGVHGGEFYSWLKRQGYPPGFQVLCFNCNSGRHMNGGVCPHEYDREWSI